MNIYPSFTDIRSYLSHQFFALRTNARRDALWAKLMGKTTQLATFPHDAPDKSPNRRFLGVQEVPVQGIIGTISRQNDFDHQFRPLNTYLRERWVNAYISLDREGWSPILVHKVGESYYLEDGHHRVSIAQVLGLTFIPAKVWEYPCLTKESKNCQPDPCPERGPVKVYASLTD
ncbi:MAG TPA: ParB/RepB/Spo0J family partition protein [Anaerolineales bacterium]|nr:ParB/RepB/Spo0J family partition protein [Anaerolineales bacterium]